MVLLIKRLGTCRTKRGDFGAKKSKVESSVPSDFNERLK